MAREFALENEKARDELVALAKRITDEDLGKADADGWTIGVVYAHVAFWDQRTLALLGRWRRSGVKMSPVDTDVINESLTPLLKTIPGREAVDLAVATTETVCREIESLPDGLVSEIEALGDKMRLHRYIHWRMHGDQIRKILQA